jgi:cytochrome c-type biogenesis protein CcmH
MLGQLCKRFGWLAVALLVAGLAGVVFVAKAGAAPPAQNSGPAAAGARDATPNDVMRVARQLYCPVCPNTPLDVCETQACQDWRELIRQKLSAGASDQEVVNYFVVQYGQRVLAQPPARGFNLLVWLIPLAALVAGASGLAIVLRSWLRRRAVRQIAPAPDPGGLPDNYVARVERELQMRR